MTTSPPAPVIEVKALSIGLPRGSDRALAVDAVSFSIAAGRTLCIVGESGSGKSVLAMTLMGLQARELQVQSGQALFCSDPAMPPIDLIGASNSTLRSLRGRAMGMVFQEPMTALNPVMTCGAQLVELLCQHTTWDKDTRQRAVLAIFERVRLPEPSRIMRSFPHQLSGGQRQRVVIAMAMLLKPRVLICDEPTTALDVTTQREVLSLIAQLQSEEGSAVLFITHDMSVVGEIADDVLVMHRGQAVEYGSREQVLRSPKADYTNMLLQAVPGRTPPKARILDGNAPVQLRAEGLHKHYETRSILGVRRTTPALVDATLTVRQGETVGIVGESGCGKSTLARCMVRLIEPSAGHLYWGDQELARASESRLRSLRHRVQVVFQDPNRSLDPRQTVGQAIMEGARNFGVHRERAIERAKTLLERVALSPSAFDRYPSQFSGGQRQRIAIARALACEPLALIADEAVSALDVSVQAQILTLLREVQREFSLALLFITHDLRVAAQLCDRVIVMQQGRIVEQGATSELFANPAHPYTRALFDAAPKGL
jgi:peptide/nickel transport system ATP-binding protein